MQTGSGANNNHNHNGGARMKKIGLIASLLAAFCITSAPSAQSQELYWATSGTFGPFNI